eukprot:9472043-Pyramimonas_sp.AAC.1
MKLRASQFASLLPGEQSSYRRRAGQQRRDADDNKRRSSKLRTVGGSEVQVAACAWGLATAEMPVCPEKFLEAARSRARPRRGLRDDNEESLTFNSWGYSCREAYQRGSLVRDAGHM